MPDQQHEIAGASRYEWQIAAGSSTAHVIDAAIPHARRPNPRWSSGPRALCKRYPQRNREDPWFGLSVMDPEIQRGLGYFWPKRCMDCADALDVVLPPESTQP